MVRGCTVGLITPRVLPASCPKEDIVEKERDHMAATQYPAPDGLTPIAKEFQPVSHLFGCLVGAQLE